MADYGDLAKKLTAKSPSPSQIPGLRGYGQRNLPPEQFPRSAYRLTASGHRHIRRGGAGIRPESGGIRGPGTSPASIRSRRRRVLSQAGPISNTLVNPQRAIMSPICSARSTAGIPRTFRRKAVKAFEPVEIPQTLRERVQNLAFSIPTASFVNRGVGEPHCWDAFPFATRRFFINQGMIS